MGNNVVKESDLEAGDHIYVDVGLNSRRHGIVYLNGDVVHFAPDSDSQTTWYIVAQNCVEQFLNGGKLQRYEYGKEKWGSGWTSAKSDPPKFVMGRVMNLLKHGFQVPPDLAETNPTEVFAFYCKTGLFTPPPRSQTGGYSGHDPRSRPSFGSQFPDRYPPGDFGSRPGASGFCGPPGPSGFCGPPGRI